MRRRGALWIAFGLVFSCAAFAPLRGAAAAERVCAVVVAAGEAPAASRMAARAGLRAGLIAAGMEMLEGASVLSDVLSYLDPKTGACDLACEQRMRRKVNLDRMTSDKLVLGRISVVGSQFLLRISSEDRTISAAGPVDSLEEAATRLAPRLFATHGWIVVGDGAPERQDEWFVDGAKVLPDGSGAVQVVPGTHVVRRGDGTAPGSVRRLEIPAGERIPVPSAAAPAGERIPLEAPEGERAEAADLPPWSHAADRAAPGALAAHVGVSALSRRRAVDGSGGAGFDAGFTGAGPSARVEIAHGPWRNSVEGAWLDFGGSRAHFDPGDGDPVSAGGGSTWLVRVAADRRFGAGGTMELAPWLGLGYERHSADDPVGAEGPMKLLPSHRRLAVEAGGAMRIAIGPVAASISAGAVPWSTLTESPSGTSGREPRPALGFVWGGGIDVGAGGRWSIVVRYAGERRFVRFRGDAAASIEPPIEEATVVETLHGVAVSVGRGF